MAAPRRPCLCRERESIYLADDGQSMWPCLVPPVKKISHKHEWMYGILNEFYLRIFLWMGVIFRDESNEPSFIIIGYRDTTVTSSNHPQLVRSKASLATALLQYHSCGDGFVL